MSQSVKKLLEPVASLRLTVALLAMGMFLVFAGTLAQVDQGIWTVTREYFRGFAVWIELQMFVPRDLAQVGGRFPFPGGFTLGGLLMVNLLAAHTVRFRLTRKRLGILAIHAGVVVLLLGEMVTAVWAEEGNMTIDEGGSASYVEDIRHAELAVIDPTNADRDRVVVVPGAMLVGQTGPIQHELLPFEVSVDRWLANSRLVGPMEAPGGFRPEATAGAGQRVGVRELPRATGVDSDSGVDLPSAYVTLRHQGQVLGKWLVSLWLDPQPVEVAGKTYQVSLRFKRTYKPYTMHLIDFRHDKFVGTEKPRNFSSLVRLIDPSNNEDRQVLIYMNNPLRYGGETFYQSAFKEGDTGTILQVVRNPGWLLPYVACTLVSLGMLAHFGQNLVGFVGRARP